MKKFSYLMMLMVVVACSETGYRQTEMGIVVAVKKTKEKILLEVHEQTLSVFLFPNPERIFQPIPA